MKNGLEEAKRELFRRLEAETTGGPAPASFPVVIRVKVPLIDIDPLQWLAGQKNKRGEAGTSHVDPNSYLVLVRSKDNGESWTAEPELIFAHPFGGSQDPCMTQLRDGAIVCSSYGWALLRGDAAEKVPPTLRHGDFVFMGGYLVRSLDGGHSWTGPVIPPSVPGNEAKNVFREPCPAYNRGPMWEGRDGSLYWAVASQSRLEPRLTEVHLMASKDAGLSWEYRQSP